MSLCGSDTEVSLTGCDVSSGLPRERDPAKCATSPMHTTTHTQTPFRFITTALIIPKHPHEVPELERPELAAPVAVVRVEDLGDP